VALCGDQIAQILHGRETPVLLLLNKHLTVYKNKAISKDNDVKTPSGSHCTQVASKSVRYSVYLKRKAK